MPLSPIFWNWLILTCLFLVMEVFSVSFFFIFWAMAAAVLALITWLMPQLSLPAQALWFAILSVISISLWWLLARRWQRDKNDTAMMLNSRSKQLIGRQFVLQTPIAGGQGRLQIDDSIWSVRGEDMPAGTTVVIVNADSMELDVARVA